PCMLASIHACTAPPAARCLPISSTWSGAASRARRGRAGRAFPRPHSVDAAGRHRRAFPPAFPSSGAYWLEPARSRGHLPRSNWEIRQMDARGGMGGGPVNDLRGLDLVAEINRLRKERNAVILAHYYQKPQIQDLADFVGDSLELSRKAAETDADVIAFCGVRFMAEVAKILSPQKTVILPDMDAGCSLEDSCPPEQFKRFREAHPDHIALTYINCSAAVKALSD